MAKPAARPVAVPEPFSSDENEDWLAWLNYFENHAQINGWEDKEKALWLSIRLKGNAQLVYQGLSKDEKKTYTDLTKALTERFAPAERSSVKKATLKARRRLPGETLVDFASAIRRLTAQAYGEKDLDLLDELARDYFVAGLNVELRVKVAESDPEALDAALRQAIHLEAIAEAEEGKRVPLQRMEYDRDIAVATVKSQTSEDRLLALMEQMQVTQQAILQAVSESGAVSTGARRDSGRLAAAGANRDGRRNWRRPPVCYFCQEQGHIQRYCPKLQRNGSAFGSSSSSSQAGNA